MPTLQREVTSVPRTRTGVRNLDVMGPGVVPFSSPPTPMPTTAPPLGTTDRTLSAAAGATLALLGLRCGSLSGLAMAGIGGYLLYRGATGTCPASRLLGLASPPTPAAGEVVFRAG